MKLRRHRGTLTSLRLWRPGGFSRIDKEAAVANGSNSGGIRCAALKLTSLCVHKTSVNHIYYLVTIPVHVHKTIAI
jgi:hypothetical protein